MLSERYTFGPGVKPMRVTATPAGKGAAEVLDDCEETEFCRVATAYATGRGSGKCGLWDGAALQTLRREADTSGSYSGMVLPEETTVTSSGPGIESFREIALPEGTPAGAMLDACRKECLASKRQCGAAAVDAEQATCYLGAPQSLKPRSGAPDPRWSRTSRRPPSTSLARAHEVRKRVKT